MSKPVVLITGALTGFGRATAFAFARDGARVVVSGCRDDAGEALATELRATGSEVEFIRADVRHESEVANQHVAWRARDRLKMRRVFHGCLLAALFR
jgi:NAD(P)-dependent dehydrogenase (short-subunit alcohol dehydrogenase family)